MGTAIVAIGGWLSAAAGGITAGGALSAAALVGAGMAAGGAFSSTPGAPAQLGSPVDKTTAELTAELDAPLIADEKSRKRKKAASKSQFKVDKTETESGVNIKGTEKVAGVQL